MKIVKGINNYEVVNKEGKIVYSGDVLACSAFLSGYQERQYEESKEVKNYVK